MQREFAVILLDVNMPDVDGFETAELIRRYRRSAHTPIIFITAYADEPQIARGYALGAVDYIPSPVIPEILRSKVRVFGELFELRRRLVRQADERAALAASEAALMAAVDSTRRLACLSELSHALSGLVDVDSGMRSLLDIVVPRLAPGAMVALYDAAGDIRDALCRRTADGSDTRRLDAEGVAAWRAGQAPSGASTLADAPTAAEREFLLQHGREAIGVLSIDGEATPLGAALLQEVAARAAAALVAAQLHQALQDEIVVRRGAEVRLEEAARRKDEFLAMLAQELRNPLAPIRLATELIRRTPAGAQPQVRRATETTERQLRQLTRLVDDLLDVARITQGKVELRPVTLELRALVADVAELERPPMQARRQSLTLILPPQPLWVVGDEGRLQQVVGNLLNNAHKYTGDCGHIELELRADGEAVSLVVRDDGIGMEPTLVPRVFDLFEQGKRGLDRSQGGLGIGLTLVHRLLKMHRGTIEANSDGLGRGSSFTVRLPLASAPLTASIAHEAAAARAVTPRRILVVDDNTDAADSTAALLQMEGHAVQIAHDGASALACASNFAPDIVLLDIGLPEVDGYEVARRLRLLPMARSARVFALTGYGAPADRARARDAGFDAHLLKPVDPNLLLKLVSVEPQAAPAPDSH
jgi:signal transduction histidine kinase